MKPALRRSAAIALAAYLAVCLVSILLMAWSLMP